MRLLMIEDEQDFIKRVQDACEAVGGIELSLPNQVGLTDLPFSRDAPIEEQLSRTLLEIQNRERWDLVLLDTDLSREQGSLRTQTEYRQAFLSIGVPVCRYKKRHSATRLADLQLVRHLAVDGASALWVQHEHLEGDLNKTLIPWLVDVSNGFCEIRSLYDRAAKLGSRQGPAALLAALLERPGLQADLLGYTAQNAFFFADVASSSDTSESVTSTQLGYWLHNYILAFPGPILNAVAAAAYVNLSPACFEHSLVQALVRDAIYKGPFHRLGPYYWREELGALLDQHNGDLASAPSLEDVTLDRIVDDTREVAFYCILSRTAIPESEAAVNPDWIPPGAQMARIRESDFDELGPMLRS